MTDPRLAHRPTDPALLRREAIKLLLLGCEIDDAAQALGLPGPALYRLLGDTSGERQPGDEP